MIAVRPFEPHLPFAKPASKLINAWRAGSPGAGRPGVRQPRDPSHRTTTFLEVADAGAALAALRRLRDDPELYSRIVAAGHRRAPEFSFDALTEQLGRLLFETLPQRVAVGALPWSHRLPLSLRIPLRRAVRLLRAARKR